MLPSGNRVNLGVQKAMKVLKDYYSSDGDDHGAASGAGSGASAVVSSIFLLTLVDHICASLLVSLPLLE